MTDHEQATIAEIAAARALYGSDDIDIDNNAARSPNDEGVWVQAWVFVRGDADNLDDDGQPCPDKADGLHHWDEPDHERSPTVCRSCGATK